MRLGHAILEVISNLWIKYYICNDLIDYEKTYIMGKHMTWTDASGKK